MLSYLRTYETLYLLSKFDSEKHIDVELKMEELDLTAEESEATYAEIKDYVMNEHGLKMSNLYIS